MGKSVKTHPQKASACFEEANEEPSPVGFLGESIPQWGATVDKALL